MKISKKNKEGKSNSRKGRRKGRTTKIHFFKFVKKISKRGYPTNQKEYSEAHKEANRRERKKYGDKDFKEIENIRLEKNELLGSHSKAGQILVSKKVPPQYIPNVVYHEEQEHSIMQSKNTKKDKIIRRKKQYVT